MRPALLLSCLLCLGCGPLSGGVDPGEPRHESEAVLEAEPGLEAAVRVDSLSWLPLLVDPEYDDAPLELEGVFAARFSNVGTEPVSIRYDLRFYDRDAFLVDLYIPLGQPVLLAPGEVRWVRGDFLLRATVAADLDWLATMQLVAKVMHPSE